jgi:hypothetical protein
MLIGMPTTITSDPVAIDGAGARRPSTRRSLLHRLGRAVRLGVRTDALLGLSDIVAVLELARTTVATGWVQNRWYIVSGSAEGWPSHRRRGVDAPDNVAGACVTGAIAVAVRQRHAHADLARDAGPAIDYVWDAVQGASGRDIPAAAGRAWPREARVSRLRDIVRWNDEAGRTKVEVLTVLDDAASRAIMSAMRPAAAGSP